MTRQISGSQSNVFRAPLRRQLRRRQPVDRSESRQSAACGRRKKLREAGPARDPQQVVKRKKRLHSQPARCKPTTTTSKKTRPVRAGRGHLSIGCAIRGGQVAEGGPKQEAATSGAPSPFSARIYSHRGPKTSLASRRPPAAGRQLPPVATCRRLLGPRALEYIPAGDS